MVRLRFADRTAVVRTLHKAIYSLTKPTMGPPHGARAATERYNVSNKRPSKPPTFHPVTLPLHCRRIFMLSMSWQNRINQRLRSFKTPQNRIRPLLVLPILLPSRYRTAHITVFTPTAAVMRSRNPRPKHPSAPKRPQRCSPAPRLTG